jgi:hypothetical protein
MGMWVGDQTLVPTAAPYLDGSRQSIDDLRQVVGRRVDRDDQQCATNKRLPSQRAVWKASANWSWLSCVKRAAAVLSGWMRRKEQKLRISPQAR